MLADASKAPIDDPSGLPGRPQMHPQLPGDVSGVIRQHGIGKMKRYGKTMENPGG
jgi:hypothetical protein